MKPGRRGFLQMLGMAPAAPLALALAPKSVLPEKVIPEAVVPYVDPMPYVDTSWESSGNGYSMMVSCVAAVDIADIEYSGYRVTPIGTFRKA